MGKRSSEMKGTAHLEQQLLHAILHTIDEAIHVVNDEGVTIFYNHVAAEHDGMNQVEVIGKHVLDSFPSLSEESSTLFTVLRTGKPIFRRPQRFQNVRGKVIESINTTLPIYLDGKLSGAVEISKNYSNIQSLTDQIHKLQLKMSTYRDKKKQQTYYAFRDYLTNNEIMIHRIKELEKVAKADGNVLIFGETGTGKEVIVQGIHHASSRHNGPFIVQNCAAIPEQLLEGLLFGTTKGSYTGAIDRPGLFELAHGGTLFLDELNSLPIHLQGKLLRVLEDGVVRRVGGTSVHHVDVRVLAAMNEFPKLCIEKNKLREDLFYRIGMFSFHLLPLREKKEDILTLLYYFTQKESHGEKIIFTKEVENLLLSYHWPGNIRELKSVVQYVLTMREGEAVTVHDLPQQFQFIKTDQGLNEIRPLREVVEEAEQTLILKAMEASNGNVTLAAKQLCIPRQTLQYKLGKISPKIKQSLNKVSAEN